MVDDTDSSPENIVSLDPGDWRRRGELKRRLGLGDDEFDHRLETGDIERCDTPEGARYRFVGDLADGEPDDGSTALIAVQLNDWTDAREALGRLEARLESSKEDVRRAVDYARDLEAECDRLADVAEQYRRETSEVRSQLDEQRGRTQQLQQQYADVLERLEELQRIRGRYHLERNRREDADQTVSEQREELEHLRRHIQRLTEALEEAQRRGFSVELGALSVEWKR